MSVPLKVSASHQGRYAVHRVQAVQRGALILAVAGTLACGPATVDTRTDRSALAASMGDPDMAVAIAATKRLSELHGAEALTDVLRDGTPSARGLAALELRAFKSQEVASALTTALGDSEAGVRSKAADSLGHVCDASCVPALEKAAASDPDEFTRRIAAQAIDNIR